MALDREIKAQLDKHAFDTTMGKRAPDIKPLSFEKQKDPNKPNHPDPDVQFEFPEPVAIVRDEQLGFDEFEIDPDNPDYKQSPYIGKTIIIDIVVLTGNRANAIRWLTEIEENLVGWKPDEVRSMYLDFQQPLTETEGDPVMFLGFLRYVVEADGHYQPLSYTEQEN